MQDTADSPFFSTRLAVVEGDRPTAEMLHTFFRLMEFEVALVDPGPEAVDTICRLGPAVALVDLDLPDLRALELADELTRCAPGITIVFLSSGTACAPDGAVIVAKPQPTFEEMLRVFEVVLEYS